MDVKNTAAIVTVEPNLEISSIYDRMPAILRGQQAIDDWLNTRDVQARDAVKLASPPPPGAMKYHPVGLAIGQALADGPDLIRPLTAEELTAEAEARPVRRKKAAGDVGQGELF